MAAELDPSAELCLCGARGCDLAAQHAAAFVGKSRGRRGTRVKHRRGRSI